MTKLQDGSPSKVNPPVKARAAGPFHIVQTLKCLVFSPLYFS
jgi:hypothetical protein